MKIRTANRRIRARWITSVAVGIAAVAILSAPLALPVFTQIAGAQQPVSNRAVAVLLCRFADKPDTFGFTPEQVQRTWVGDASLDLLVQEDSLGTVNLTGSRAFGWFTLPGAAGSYPASDTLSIPQDCVARARAAGVDFSSFTYVAVYTNSALAGASGRAGTTDFSGRRSPTVWNTMTLNASALTSPGLVMHELGHVLGGVHNNDPADALGGASWLGTTRNTRFPASRPVAPTCPPVGTV